MRLESDGAGHAIILLISVGDCLPFLFVNLRGMLMMVC